MKIEYRVREVTRYIVTKFTQDDESGCSVGTCGEYDNADLAYTVGYALAKADSDRLCLPPGDMTVMFPEHARKVEPITVEAIQRGLTQVDLDRAEIRRGGNYI